VLSDGISEDVTKFIERCECLLSALACQTEFSETEQGMISYYCREIIDHTQSLKNEYENR
jgi:hypothetical protein